MNYNLNYQTIALLSLYFLSNILFAVELDDCKKYGEEGKKYFRCAEFPIQKIFNSKYKKEIFVNSIEGRNDDEVVILSKHLLDTGLCKTYSSSIFTYSKKLKSFYKKFDADSKIIDLATMSNGMTILSTNDVKGFCYDTPGISDISLRSSILNKKSKWIVQSSASNTIYYFDEDFNLLDDFFSVGLGYESSLFQHEYHNGFLYILTKKELEFGQRKFCLEQIDEFSKNFISRKCLILKRKNENSVRLFTHKNSVILGFLDQSKLWIYRL